MSGSNDGLPVISAAQVAVLAQKVDTVIENHAEIKGLLVGMSQQYNGLTNIVAQMQEKVLQLERDQREAKDTAFHQGKSLSTLRQEVTQHSTIWKLVGGSVTLIVAAAAWGFNSLGSIKDESRQQDRRIIILEMRADRSPPFPKPPLLETPQ